MKNSMACLAAALLASCAGREPRLRPIEVPETFFARPQDAIAFAVEGKKGKVYRNATIPAKFIPKEEAGLTHGVYLLKASDGHFHRLKYHIYNDSLITDLKAGTYIVVANPVGQLASAYSILGKFINAGVASLDQEIFRKLCTQILCAPDLIKGEEIYGKIPELVSLKDKMPPIEGMVGGWKFGVGDPCKFCMRRPPPPPDEESDDDGDSNVPGNGGLSLGVCISGRLIFHDDFEDDTVGSLPVTSPAGAPPNDSLSFSSSGVKVVNSTAHGSKAVQLERAAMIKVFLKCIVSPSPMMLADNLHCINFRIYPIKMFSPLKIMLKSGIGQLAISMSLVNGKYNISTGDGLFVALAPPSPHNVQILLDVDVGTVTVKINDVIVVSGARILNSAFSALVSLDFEYMAAILEGFEGSSEIDDIKIRSR